MIAQDKAEITVKVTKDGAVVKDTTYTYDDLKKAKHAVRMMEIMSSEDFHADGEHMMHKKMMFVSEDGKVTEIKEGNELDEKIYISKDGDKVEVIVKKIKVGDCDHDVKMHREVIVIADGENDEQSTWTIEEGEDGEVIVINEDGKQIKIIKKILSEGDEDIKVEVHVKEEKVETKKKRKKDK